MADFVASWLAWPSMERLMGTTWAWPLAENFHFIGLALLVGIVAMFDLRLLGMAKRLPVAPLRRLLPLAVVGFVLCVVTGLGFVLGLGSNLIGTDQPAYGVLTNNIYLQLKLLFIFLAGANLVAFYSTGMSRAVDGLGPGDDAPLLAQVIAGASLSLWIGVIWMGRLIAFNL